MSTEFKIMNSGWWHVLQDAMSKDKKGLYIICPFIKKPVVERLLKQGKPRVMKVITRFHLGDFCDGVSDTAALRFLVEHGAEVRGVRDLHAKAYIFGHSTAVVTSANLTSAGLVRNLELGFVSTDAEIVNTCLKYFDDLWNRAGENLELGRVAEWEKRLDKRRASGLRPSGRGGLRDEGVDTGFITIPDEFPPAVVDISQAFVKFFGVSSNRVLRSVPVLEEVDRSGCHWACTYPKDKRPRQVVDGAVMFMGRLVGEPNDILVYGRAVAMRYVRGRDDATKADIKRRNWKEKWPHYIRVHHAEFVSGPLSNGVSLNEMKRVLGSDTFASTKRHAAAGKGNIDPNRAYMQKPEIELSPEAFSWLNAKLEQAFKEMGMVPSKDLDALDWPAIPESEKP